MPQGWTTSGEPEEDWWIRQIHEGLVFRKKFACEPEWPKWRNWYRGKWPRGTLPTNVYFKMLRTLVPRVYYRNPSVSVTPTLPGIEQMLFAKLLERADNKLLDLMGVKGQMKRGVQLTTMFGTSVPMLGYGAAFSPTPEPLDTSAPTGTKRLRNRVEYNSLVHDNTPWFLTAHPGDVVFPDKCATWEDARWICLTTRRTSYDLESDPRLKNNKGLPEGGKSNIIYDGGPGRIMPNGVRVWLIRDKKTGKVFVMAPDGDGGKKVMLCEDDALQIDGGLPAYPLIFNTDDEAIWGIPDSQIIAPQQAEINEIRTLIMRHRRASLLKMLYEENSIEPDEIDKMTDDDVRAAIKVKNINGIRDLPPQAIPPALLQSEQLTAQDVQEILGLGTNQFGEYAPGSADRSATEANIVNQATQIRVDERRDTCADILTAFVSDMNQVIMREWDTEQVSEIVGPEGVSLWVKWSPAMLAKTEGKYELKIDPDSSVPLTKQVRAQRAVQGYTLFSQNPLVDPVKLTTMTINEIYSGDVQDLLKSMANTSPDNPMDVAQAVQHLQGMQSAMPKPNGAAQGNTLQ